MVWILTPLIVTGIMFGGSFRRCRWGVDTFDVTFNALLVSCAVSFTLWMLS